MPPTTSRLPQRLAVHLSRVALLGVIVFLVQWQHQQQTRKRSTASAVPPPLMQVQKIFPSAASLNEQSVADESWAALDATGEKLGDVLQTSPASDHVVGFSGPTNVLIGLDGQRKIVRAIVLDSRDTRDHVRQILDDESFLSSFSGVAADEVANADVDAVTGATLTSRAIQEAIVNRLGGPEVSLRFPEPLTVEDAAKLLPQAAVVVQSEHDSAYWIVKDADGREIGALLRTSPAADNIVGYQGPTEARIGFDAQGRVVGIALGRSFDNDEYVQYVREDDYFLSLLNDKRLEDLAELDLGEAEIEGVSGATMTSMAVAQGMIAAAERRRAVVEAAERKAASAWQWRWRDFGTAAVIVLGLLVGMTSLRSRKVIRVGFQLVLIVYLGLVNGDMISQAMLFGWAQYGIPWEKAGGLILLTAAAFVIPWTTGRNVYCSHLCPHGAAQQLLMHRLPWRLHLPKKISKVLRMLPAALLAWCVLVVFANLPLSLVDIEPFDAWVFRVAGWATITIAVVGLAASTAVPMAYCRYGCPTGALLGYARWHGRSDRVTGRDAFAWGMVVAAAALTLIF